MATSVIVIPCYNEAARLRDEAFREFAAKRPDVRFVLVNDGSSDATQARLEALEKSSPARFGLLELPRHSGKAEAVRLGMRAALGQRPDYAGYWDADLATPLDEIPHFVAVLEQRPELGAVFGARVRMLGRAIERNPLRHGLGRVFATAVAHLLGLPVYDTQCGAKLFRASEELASLFSEPFTVGWAFDVELVARWQQACAARGAGEQPLIRELPLERWTDVAGSKVGPQDFFVAWLELWRIWRRYGRQG